MSIVLLTCTFFLYMGIQVPPSSFPPTTPSYTLYNHITLSPPSFSPYWYLNSHLQHSFYRYNAYPICASLCRGMAFWKLPLWPWFLVGTESLSHLTICSHIFVIANKDIPNTDTCPVLWLNGQDINEEIKYFGTPIATDETLQDTTNNLTHLKVIDHKIKCLEWCVVPTTYALIT